MLLSELLCEKAVDSSWLVDISYNRKKKIAKMITTYKGKQTTYYLLGISRREFDKWHIAPSQGKFFHKFVKGFYDIKREA
jgi:hypothetical protein